VGSRDERFLEDQRAFFAKADESHFEWQTHNPLIALTERELLRGFPILGEGPILEVGCGEGGNLANLLSGNSRVGTEIVGLDLFEPKVAFARRQVTQARFVCGDALSLPFRDHTFAAVLCRDLLHHVDHRGLALAELRRVCTPRGAIWIFEPNGSNPLMRMLALVRPHERGILKNSPVSLRDLIAEQFADFRIELRQPMPIYRLLLHYQFGAPRLGSWGPLQALMRLWDRTIGWVLPKKWWAYIVVEVNT
jgi:ubiquinone/menaquinone biosynthesis C-methylase UbiE